ncbi:MAG: hypothetical protein K0Q43_159 [Ramlibacter sp.]|jgi:hypothetical protein|nr:hypothetical protein [Ramlibacter sp.]
MNLKPTLEIIDEVATQLEEAAKRVRAERARLEQDGDLSRAGRVLSEVTDLPSRVRLDFLVTRPLQALRDAGK